MDTERKSAFVSGIIEGLAYSRFLRDRPDETEYRCMRNWLVERGTEGWRTIFVVFRRHEDKPPAVVLNAIITRDCGK